VGEPASFEPLETLGVQAGWGDDGAALESLARRDLLRRALRRLRPDDREILVLRELEGLPGAEVAEMLELTLAAMKSRLHRARLRLAAALREVDDDAP
jgi:RNA polymerase sigma-70 factor (ECF subfamily)